MTDAREALVARQREEYGESWDVLVPEVGWTLGRIIESVIEDALPTEHDHEWQRRQNVTSSGYRMTPYEVCVVDGCDAARQVDEPAAHPPAPPTVKPSVEDAAAAIEAETASYDPVTSPGRGEPESLLAADGSDMSLTAARAVLTLIPGRTEAEIKAEGWDEGAQAGLDAGLSIAEAVHANGGVLNLADVPNAPVNPYRQKEV